MRFHRGSELWALFFDAQNSRWLPRLMGRVERVDARGGLVRGPELVNAFETPGVMNLVSVRA